MGSLENEKALPFKDVQLSEVKIKKWMIKGRGLTFGMILVQEKVNQ